MCIDVHRSSARPPEPSIAHSKSALAPAPSALHVAHWKGMLWVPSFTEAAKGGFGCDFALQASGRHC
eukprot:scaffold236233_cov26-Tisochrysis_lutea.AAC.1